MKKVLLGTTALIAAAMLPHAALADDAPVKLSISGIYQFGYGADVQEQKPYSSATLPDSAKVYGTIDLSGDTTFKNGIGAGAFIEFWGQPPATGSTSSSIRQDWIHLTGASFGEVRFGDYTDVRRAKQIDAPQWSQNDLFSANSPDIAFIGSGANSNTTTAWFGNRFMTEVAYFSPTFDGAQLSLSYAPDNGSFSSAGPGAVATAFPSYCAGGGATCLGSATQIRDIVSGALSWSGTVSGLTIAANVGGTVGSEKKNNTATVGNPNALSAGFTVGSGPWSVGASFEQTSNLAGSFGFGVNPEEIDKTGDIGATYTVGNLTAGVEWSRGIYENGVLGGADPKAHYTLDTVTPGASYIIGPGVDIDAGIAYNINHDAAGAAPAGAPFAALSSHDTILEFGTEVKF